MSIKNILVPSYWFYQPFIAIGFAKWFWMVSFLVLVLLGLVAKIVRVAKKDSSGRAKEVMRRSGNLLITMGVLGLLWFYFRQQQVAFLAWRFWFVLWIAIFAFWTYKVLAYAFKKTLPKEDQTKQEQLKKYLPKSK